MFGRVAVVEYHSARLGWCTLNLLPLAAQALPASPATTTAATKAAVAIPRTLSIIALASNDRSSAPTGSATSDSSGRHSNAWSDYRRATAPHRTSTFRCRRRIPRQQRRARQRPARFRPIASRLVATHRPLFLGRGRPLLSLRPAPAFSSVQYFATTGRRT
jgi:hypothetical protein